MASNEKVAAVVGMLCEAFGRQATPITFQAYHLVLQDVTNDQLEAAATSALQSTEKFMPTAGQLRELARLGGLSCESRAQAAWQEFDAAVARHGADRSVSFEDGLINATIRGLGGWVWCCEREGDSYHIWLRREFLGAYMRLIRDGASDDMRRGHSGRLAMMNASYPKDTLVKLGAYTGDEVLVGTQHPVLQGPTKPQERIASPGVPQLQLKNVNDEATP